MVSIGDLTTRFKTTGKAKKDTKDAEHCQAVSLPSVELSTMQRGRTTILIIASNFETR
jgi:hypothetical protein